MVPADPSTDTPKRNAVGQVRLTFLALEPFGFPVQHVRRHAITPFQWKTATTQLLAEAVLEMELEFSVPPGTGQAQPSHPLAILTIGRGSFSASSQALHSYDEGFQYPT